MNTRRGLVSFVDDTTLPIDIEIAARCDVGVLICGRTGIIDTIARLIHERSRRQRWQFIALDCANVSEAILESQLFGCVDPPLATACRDEVPALRRAHHGTLFLSNVRELSPRLQRMLFRFLETGEVRTSDSHSIVVDVRVIAATAGELKAGSDPPEFCLDLYYRLNILRLDIGPDGESRNSGLWLIDEK
jgi:DNA-binding NtrC family response regulator